MFSHSRPPSKQTPGKAPLTRASNLDHCPFSSLERDPPCCCYTFACCGGVVAGNSFDRSSKEPPCCSWDVSRTGGRPGSDLVKLVVVVPLTLRLLMLYAVDLSGLTRWTVFHRIMPSGFSFKALGWGIPLRMTFSISGSDCTAERGSWSGSTKTTPIPGWSKDEISLIENS